MRYKISIKPIKRLIDKHFEQLCILTMATLVCLPILRNRYFAFNDFSFHFMRIRGPIAALKDGQIVPQVDPGMFYGYGYGISMFYGPLPTYFGSLLRIFIPSWALVINLLSYLAVISAGLLMYRMVLGLCDIITEKFEISTDLKKFVALISALLLVTGCPILNNLYVYNGYGGLCAVSFTLLAFIGLIDLIADKKFSYLKIIIGSAGVVLCHSISALITACFIGLFVLINICSFFNYKKIKVLLISVLGAFGISAFFTLPLFENLNSKIFNVSNKDFSRVFQWNSLESMHFMRSSCYNLFFSNKLYKPNSLLIIITIILFILTLYKLRGDLKGNMVYISFNIIVFFSLFITTKLFSWKFMPSFLYIMQSVNRIFYISGILLAICVGFSAYLLINNMHIHLKKYSCAFSLCIVCASLFYSVVNVPDISPSQYTNDVSMNS